MDIEQGLMIPLPRFSMRVSLCFSCIYYNRYVTVIDKIKNILSVKKHMHLNHPLIPIFSIKDWMFCVQATVSMVHIHSCSNSLKELVNARVSQSLRIKKCDFILIQIFYSP